MDFRQVKYFSASTPKVGDSPNLESPPDNRLVKQKPQLILTVVVAAVVVLVINIR